MRISGTITMIPVPTMALDVRRSFVKGILFFTTITVITVYMRMIATRGKKRKRIPSIRSLLRKTHLWYSGWKKI